jgi:hypothetical protein
MIPRSRPTGNRLEIVGRARSQPREEGSQQTHFMQMTKAHLKRESPTEPPGRRELSSGGWREAEGALRRHAKDP